MPRPAIPATSIMLTAEKKDHLLVGRDRKLGRKGHNFGIALRKSAHGIEETSFPYRNVSYFDDDWIEIAMKLPRLLIVQLNNPSYQQFG